MKLIKKYEEMTLLERMKQLKNRKMLLLDVSSSMSLPIEINGEKRIDVLRGIVKNIPGKFLAFNTEVYDCFAGTIPDPYGGTWLSPALERLKSMGITEAVVLTDGEVNAEDQEKSIQAVKGIKLQVLYIGTGPKPEFLDKIATESGGVCTKEELTMPAELEEKITLLLGPGNAPEKRVFKL